MEKQEREALQLRIVEFLKTRRMSTGVDVLKEAFESEGLYRDVDYSKAFVSHGKRKGLLLANRPNGDAGVVHQAILANVNPMRASVWFVMALDSREKALYDSVDAIAEVFALVGRARRRLQIKDPSSRNIDQIVAELGGRF